MTHEWDAHAYHRVSGPQTGWGHKVLDRLGFTGDERVIDAGCGTGRLTADLMSRLPRGTLLAIDRSWNMLVTARANLRPQFGDRVRYAQVALPAVPVDGWADLVFSTATFHWVQDHPALFANIFQALRPGGRLVAQCGGAGNLDEAHAIAEQVSSRSPFAEFLAGWKGLWTFAPVTLTEERLRTAGFVATDVWLEPAPVTFSNRDEYCEFVATVVYRDHLERLPTTALRQQWLSQAADLAADTEPAFLLDYWRLNLQGHRPRE